MRKRKMINNLLAQCKAVPFSTPVFYEKPFEEKAFYKVMHQQFKLPSGEIITREFLKKKPAAVVIPVTVDGNVVCVIQPISLSAEGSLIEVPAGYAEDNENSAQAAMRELVEETGYVSTQIHYLGKHYQDPGSIKEPVNVFIALNCKKKHVQKLDKDEFIITLEIPKDELKQLMDEGEIKDANTFIALAKARFANYI
ncbi:MAG: NUDIX hydrolase [Clostridia bacterium]|nr:NUDIX hydrolase [Clostridia bacterium]